MIFSTLGKKADFPPDLYIIVSCRYSQQPGRREVTGHLAYSLPPVTPG